MKQRWDKILFGIEAVIYGVIIVFFMGIVSNIWNYKYAKVSDWKAFLGYLIMGIVIPIVGIIAANILIYRKKKKWQ